MAGYDELDKFVRKFVNLWQAGCEASLQVETRDGNAFANLRVGLGKAQPLHEYGQQVGGCRGGSPAKQRRRVRREAERQQAQATAEHVGTEEQIKVGQDTLENTAEKVVFKEMDQDSDTIAKVANEKVELQNVEDLTEEVKLEPVVEMENQEYELKVAAHKKCKNYDIIEAIEVNFDGALDNLKVEENDKSRYFDVHKKESKELTDEKDRNLFTYRLVVRDLDQAKRVVESWKNKSQFDDLAFKNAEYGRVRVRILEVNKV